MDSLSRLRIITNGIVIVNVMFRVCIAGCRCAPVRIQGFTYLLVWDRLRWALFGFHVDLPRRMKLGVPVFTASLNLCLV
jgi:hypothetical protein